MRCVSEVVWRQSESVREMALDDDLSLFDTVTGTALALNGTARDVWALADGTTTVDEVIATLAQAYRVDPSQIAPDVGAALQQLRDAGVIVPATT